MTNEVTQQPDQPKVDLTAVNNDFAQFVKMADALRQVLLDVEAGHTTLSDGNTMLRNLFKLIEERSTVPVRR